MLKVVEQLVVDIANGSECEAFEAAKAIVNLQPRKATSELVAIMMTSEGPHNKAAAAYALSWLGKNDEALEALIVALSAADLDDAVRGQAAEGIGAHKPSKRNKLRPNASKAILEALNSHSPEIRFWSCFAAGMLKLEEALPFLKEIEANDKGICPGWWYVSEEAEDAISRISGKSTKDRVPLRYRKPIPPGSVVRLKKLWPNARKQGHEKGEIRKIGYYSRQDGLDCVWLVDTEGAYSWTTDHEWLYEKFEVLEYSEETDLYGDEREQAESRGTMPAKVVLIVDPEYGDCLAAMPPHAPVWIIDSDANTPVVKRLWQERPESHLTGITSFKPRAGVPPEEQVIAVLEQIDLHYGEASTETPYCTLEVIGCSISEKIRRELFDYGLVVSESTDVGFVANRHH